MRLSLLSLGSFTLINLTNAQYFSTGWTPGQAVTKEAAAAVPTYTPPEAVANPPGTGGFSSIFDVSQILAMEPFVSLFARFGVNITERLKDARQAALWDERVQLITDDNYQDLIVNEELSEQEEKDRVWFLVISVTAAKQEGVSKILDDVFDSAYNETQIAGDLPHVRWGRIDYLNVTAITTKWGIWQAPYLVVLRNRGQELRFYKPHQLRIKADVMREFLKVDGWDQTQPWSTAYSPGGDREYIMDFLAFWITKTYNTIVMIPRWLLFIISGTIASVAINFMHRGSPPPPKRNNPQSQPPQTTVPITPVPSSPQTPKRSGVKQRKGKK